MLRPWLRFFTPTAYTLTVFLFLSSILLFQFEERYIEHIDRPADKIKHLNEHRYGKPFIVYIKREESAGKFYYAAIAYDLAIAYAVTLLIFGVWALLSRLVVGQSFKQRGWAFLVLILLGIIPYGVMYIKGASLLIAAVESRQFWSARVLIKIGISPNRLSTDGMDFPLKEAAYNKDFKMIEVLTKRGAEVNMANRAGETALHTATRENTVKVMEQLITQGARVNAADDNGRTPLHYANHLEAVQLLLAHKALVDLPDVNGRTPLFLVEGVGSRAHLLKLGAKGNLVDKQGSTPLHFVRNLGDVALLAKAGVNVNQRNNMGKTALHLLVPVDKTPPGPQTPELVKALVQQGAQVDIPDRQGLSPLHYAIKYCNPSQFPRTAVEIGRIVYAASEEVKLQSRNKKLIGQLAVLVSEDSAGCWKLMGGK